MVVEKIFSYRPVLHCREGWTHRWKCYVCFHNVCINFTIFKGDRLPVLLADALYYYKIRILKRQGKNVFLPFAADPLIEQIGKSWNMWWFCWHLFQGENKVDNILSDKAIAIYINKHVKAVASSQRSCSLFSQLLYLYDKVFTMVLYLFPQNVFLIVCFSLVSEQRAPDYEKIGSL